MFVAILRSICAYTLAFVFLFPAIILIWGMALISQDWVRNSTLFYGLLCYVYTLLVALSGAKLRVSGEEHMPNGPVILVANHQSSLDIPVIGLLLKQKKHVWYALSYYAVHPLFKHILRAIGFAVDHDRPTASARKIVENAAAIKDAGLSVVIFPEGGRYIDGAIHQYMRGFVTLSQLTGYPVVPVYMPYNGEVLPPGGILLRGRRLVAIIGKPMFRAEGEDDRAFCARVQGWFEEQNKKYYTS